MAGTKQITEKGTNPKSDNQQKQAFESEISCKDDHQERADANTARVSGDKVTGLRNTDIEVSCHIGQNGHHAEFGNAQC